MVNMQMQDTTLRCSECGQEFTFSASEQASYARSGQRPPALCAFCRAARMLASGSSDSGSGHGGRSDRGDRGARSEHTMYAAVCDQCGKQTKVPFEPRGTRRVYCPECYQRQQESGNGGYSGGVRGRSRSNSRR